MKHLDEVRLMTAIIRDEGAVIEDGLHKMYKDHLGYWTIGYGKLVDPEAGGGLTEHEAQFLLYNSIPLNKSIFLLLDDVLKDK